MAKKQKKSNEKQLNKMASEMYRGAKMGTQTIRTMLTKTKDPKFKEELFRQLESYNEIESKIYNELLKRNIQPIDINPLQSASAWLTIQFETMFNKKPSHLATMLIKGNNMGVIGITKVLNKNTNSNDFITDFALDFINLMESNNENLKPFLI